MSGEAITDEHPAEREQRVTPLELFFDLVFVFAITQVTGLLAADPSWRGLGRGILVLGALWWAWAGYAWLTNTIDHDEGLNRLAMFVAMAAMLVAALATPEAFGDDALLFAAGYFVVRAMHVVLYALGAPDVGVRQAILRSAPVWTLAPALLFAAAALDGAAQGAVWLVALGFDYGGTYLAGTGGYTLHAAHFAERFGLIVIIALGESIVAIGVGTDVGLGVGVVTAAVLAIAVSAALWWAYFDVVAIVAQRKLTEARGRARIAIARDSYGYLHLPMIAGIVLVALGFKKTIEHVSDPLETVPAVALCGGVALYLLAHIAVRLRNVRSLNRPRLVCAGIFAALVPLAVSVDALVALAVVACVCAALIAYEAVAYREARARVRATG
jgi:low temperature requirement protein LtrA